MNRSQVSATAQGTAAMRAFESARPAGERICYDPLARQLTGMLTYLLIKLFAGYGERRTGGALTFIVCRCRYFDDALQARLATGAAQVVILGAGLDSRAYREPWLPAGVRFFEVDHPATQASKLARLKHVLGALPGHVTYVPVDFNTETLDQLLPAGFDPQAKTVFLWEGVTYYLEPEGVDATLAWVQAHAPPGSAIIFDYQHAPPGAAPARPNRLYAVLARLSGEQRNFSIAPGQIEPFLIQRGFTHVAVADAAQLEHLYCTGPNQGRKVSDNFAIVQAEIGADQV